MGSDGFHASFSFLDNFYIMGVPDMVVDEKNLQM